jgi:hypothetical protein
MNPQILVSDLTQIYRIPEREAGLRAAVRSLVQRSYKDVLAADALSCAAQ